HVAVLFEFPTPSPHSCTAFPADALAREKHHFTQTGTVSTSWIVATIWLIRCNVYRGTIQSFPSFLMERYVNITSQAKQSVGNLALIVAGAVCVLNTPAHAQLFGGDDQARQAILSLRQEVANLREESRRARLQLATQIEQLQSQMSQMRGQIETLTKQVSDARQAQRDLYMDMAEQQPGASNPAALLNAP